MEKMELIMWFESETVLHPFILIIFLSYKRSQNSRTESESLAVDFSEKKIIRL